MQQAGRVRQRRRDVRPRIRRPECQHVAYDPQRMQSPLPRWDDVVHSLGKQQCADAVTLPGGSQCQDRRDFDPPLALGGRLSEVLGSGPIHDQQYRELALLDERLDVG